MTSWFEDLPLDFTRPETREFERLVVAGYPEKDSVMRLAENTGLDLSAFRSDSARGLTREILKKGRTSNRLLQLALEVFADPGQEAIHSRLERLFAGREASLAAAALERRPSLATLATLPPSTEVWASGESAPRPLASPGVEKTINAAAGFADPAVFRQRLAEAEIRTARIEIGGKPKGTGFLVGDSLLLTNWHVVSGGVEGAVARFDHKVLAGGNAANKGRAVPFATDWLVAHSPHDAIRVELGVEGPTSGTWDFALIRLSESVGSQAIGQQPDDSAGEPRGHYELEGTAYHFDAEEPILILGHPEGHPTQLSYASPSGVAPTVHGSRIRYQTNTEGGSSGSPVFNRDWRVVGLHHAAGPTSIPGDFNLQTKGFNQGIPIFHIVSNLKEQLASKAVLRELGLS